jgi:hypothetical protein
LDVTVIVHGVAVQAPFHPEKAEPAAGLAVKVTTVPYWMLAEHVPVFPEQEMPPTLLVTVPVPVPLVKTLSV